MGWSPWTISCFKSRTAKLTESALCSWFTAKYEEPLADLSRARTNAGFDAKDKIRQLQAMMQLDVSQEFGGSLRRAAEAVKAKGFVVVAKFDHVVTPGPAKEFASLLGAKILELHSDCGHLATACEYRRLNEAVAEFLRSN